MRLRRLGFQGAALTLAPVERREPREEDAVRPRKTARKFAMTRPSIGLAAPLLLVPAACAPTHINRLASHLSSSSGAMATAHPDNQPMTGANTQNTYDALGRIGSGANGMMTDNARR